MYENFFGLDRSPFGTVPDPAFIFWSKAHEQSFAMFRYGVMSNAQLTVLTGEIGSGKTTLLRCLLLELPDWITVGLISNAQAGRGELLHWILKALHLDFGNDPYVHLLDRFHDYAVECFAAERRLVLIFDEAQNLSVDMLEELRLLSNINADGDTLVQVILVGQPQLRDLIREPSMVQLAQRIRAGYHLENLDPSEVRDYIRHRLETAGARREIFDATACSMIAEGTGGVPRLINSISDLCLLSAQEVGTRSVDGAIVEQVLAIARETQPFGQFKPVAQVEETPWNEPWPKAPGEPPDSTLVLVNPVAGTTAASFSSISAPGKPGLASTSPGQRLGQGEVANDASEFWIYENWISGKAVVHRAECFYCNGGRGTGLVSANPRGGWFGPFAGRDEAKRTLMVKAQTIKNCRICIGA